MILNILFCLAISTVILVIVAVVFLVWAWRIAKRTERSCGEACEELPDASPEEAPRIPSCQLPTALFLVDYERCDDMTQLHNVVDEINRCSYQLISVTQDSNDIYTVFFRRDVVA